MTSNGFMDANTHSHFLFMVVVAVVFTFFVQFASFAFRVIAKSAMTKCTHTLSFRLFLYKHFILLHVKQHSSEQQEEKNESLYFIIHRLM